MNRIFLNKTSLLTYSVVTILMQPAFAQTKIEQMVVTAQKRSQDVQAVPASITAFSGEGLEQRQVRTVQDLSTSVPNLTFANNNSQPEIAIRGVVPDGVSGTIDPSTALHIDGVYQPRVIGMNLVMNDIEALEVLRGPQGTLYGRNANAGVINMITKKPTDLFEGAATVFAGSYGRYGARGYISGPVSDKISLRLSALLDRDSGYGRNFYTGNRILYNRSYGARLSARIKPIDDVTVDLSVSRFFSTGANPIFNIIAPPGQPALGDGSGEANYAQILSTGMGQATQEPWRIYNNPDPQETTYQTSATAVITWDVAPNMTFKSITGVIEDYFSASYDEDATPFRYLSSTIYGRGVTFSQEFNLNINLWDRLDTVVGLYYLDDHYNGGLWFPIWGFPQPLDPGMTNIPNINNQFAKSKAAFLDMTFSVTDDLRLLGGIRRTLDKKVVYQNTQSVSSNPFFVFGGPCDYTRSPDLKYSSTTGKAGLQYDFTPDIMAYVQWQNGFKTGGYNPSVCGNAFEPEKIRSWEGGIKSTLFNGSTTLNISVFDYNYKNLQLSRVQGLATIVDNAATAKIRGAEIEAASYLGDDLRVDIGIGILDTKYLNYSSAEIPGGPVIDLSGNQLQKAPKFTINAGLEYTMRVGDFGDLKARGELFHSSRIYFTPFNEPFAQQDGYTTYNAFLTLTPDDSPYQFHAFIRNITNKAVLTGALRITLESVALGQWGKPRTFGFEATARF